jgi:hypothetical protein
MHWDDASCGGRNGDDFPVEGGGLGNGADSG